MEKVLNLWVISSSMVVLKILFLVWLHH